MPPTHKNQPALSQLRKRLRENRQGAPLGVFSVCSSHRTVLESTFRFAANKSYPVLVESTCNQVNQFGGYTGKTPAQFSAELYSIAGRFGISPDRLILGGDHLGPYPWRSLPSSEAMSFAKQLVKDCVAAGYSKIHLDASMRCADDDPDLPLAVEASASRTAQLCQVSESNLLEGKQPPLYVIGSEVPAPGGEHEFMDPQVTQVESVAETIRVTKQAFHKMGLEDAWDRVIGIVVQPGVEFYNQDIKIYDPAPAADLSEFIHGLPDLVYEAHSTDYQTELALEQLVQGHFAILKVGPELTFVYREIIYALEQIELEIASYDSSLELSGVSEIIDHVMVEQPEYWSGYYSGSNEVQAFDRKFSYLDRIRYYWNQPRICQAVEQLITNLESCTIPSSLISQYLPGQYQLLTAGLLGDHPGEWIHYQLALVLEKYYRATTPSGVN